MNGLTNTRGKAARVRRGLATLGVVAATVGSTLVLGSSTATAAEFTSADREPYVELTDPMLVGRDRVYSAFYKEIVMESLEYGGLTVGASPATSDPQQVTVAYLLERFDGAHWETVKIEFRFVEVKGFERAYVTRGAYQIPTQVAHLYRVTYHLGWTDKATGHSLVGGTVSANAAGDSVCVTTRTACETTGDGKLSI